MREILPRMHSNVPNYAKREKVVRETGFSFDSFAKSKVLKTRDETSSGRVELYEKPFFRVSRYWCVLAVIRFSRAPHVDGEDKTEDYYIHTIASSS